MILTRAELAILEELSIIRKEQRKIMATVQDILNAQAQEKADIAALVTGVGALLAAFAAGSITSAQAQAIVTEMQSEDSSVTGLTAAINAALNPPAPAPTPTPTPAPAGS